MRIKWIEDHPVEAAIFIISLGLLVYSVGTVAFHLTSIYVPVLAAGLPEWGMWISTTYFAATAIPGLIAPFYKKVPNVWLEWATFSMFMSYLFLSILRVVAYGWFPFTWFGLLVVSACSGVFRLYLRSHRHQ